MRHRIENIYCLASTALYMLLCTLHELALNSLCGNRLDRTELQCLATHYLSNVTIFSGRPDWRWQQKPCIRLEAEWGDVWCIINRLCTTFLENQSFEEGAVLRTSRHSFNFTYFTACTCCIRSKVIGATWVFAYMQWMVSEAATNK